MTTFKVGQFNTGCENKVKQRLQRFLPTDWDKAFEGCTESIITVSHLPQPEFNKIGVYFQISVGPAKHWQNSFTMTIDDVRNLSDVALDKELDTKARVTLLELKAMIDQGVDEQ